MNGRSRMRGVSRVTFTTSAPCRFRVARPTCQFQRSKVRTEATSAESTIPRTTSMQKVRWGILSTAAIGLNKVIPAMQKSEHCEIAAIASRDRARAESAAHKLGIRQIYGSYEELLADPTIEAIYNPLPNHLHVSWSIRALEAGKHVLCEKPIGLSAAEGQQLVDAARKHPHLKLME